jgi:hypothetical protein
MKFIEYVGFLIKLVSIHDQTSLSFDEGKEIMNWRALNSLGE